MDGTTAKIWLAAFVGGLLYWLALPPIGISFLGWVALTPWIWIVAQRRPLTRREWQGIWLASFCFWLATLYFIPIPHWALWFGWPALCAYLSIFIPAFICASRFLIHKRKIPTIIVVPICWAGLEWSRNVLLTGFGMAMLGHTQFRFPLVIQIADLMGAYLVSACLAITATLVLELVSNFRTPRLGALPFGKLIVLLGCVIGYGTWRLNEDLSDADSPKVEVTIVQGSIDTVFPESEQEFHDVMQRQVDQYRGLTIEARGKFPNTELLVWPETIFTGTNYLLEDPDRESDLELRESALTARREFGLMYQFVVGALPGLDETTPPFETSLPLLTGLVSVDLRKQQQFNSAALIEKSGLISARYDKNHRVVFGEYVPFSQWLPFLDKTPIGKGLTAGLSAAAIEFGGLVFCPSICFESTVPHVIRRHVNQLRDQGTEPDWLVNLTNDGWFFGTSCLDLHLACNVLRAVEMRKPTLVAANTGISAVIDATGKIVREGPRRQTGLIAFTAERQRGWSVYRFVGDWFWKFAGWLTWGAAIWSWAERTKREQSVEKLSSGGRT